nr:hypothetical protein BOSE7B_10046 [Bosea sp. 7B]
MTASTPVRMNRSNAQYMMITAFESRLK